VALILLKVIASFNWWKQNSKKKD